MLYGGGRTCQASYLPKMLFVLMKTINPKHFTKFSLEAIVISSWLQGYSPLLVLPPHHTFPTSTVRWGLEGMRGVLPSSHPPSHHVQTVKSSLVIRVYLQASNLKRLYIPLVIWLFKTFPGWKPVLERSMTTFFSRLGINKHSTRARMLSDSPSSPPPLQAKYSFSIFQICL